MADASLGPLDVASHFTAATYDDWLASIERTLRGRPISGVLEWVPASGLTLPRVIFGPEDAVLAPTAEAVSAFDLSHMLAGPSHTHVTEAKRALDLGADVIALWPPEGQVEGELIALVGDRLRVCTAHQPNVPLSAWLPVVRPAANPSVLSSRVMIDGALFTEAGADAVTALAWQLALANRYIRQRTDHGAGLGTCTVRVALTLEPMLDVARLTATQRVLHQFADAWRLDMDVQLHAVTSYRHQTMQDVHSNLIRASLQGTAAALAGVHTLTVRPYCAGDDEAIRWALGLGHLLRSESHFATRPSVRDAWWISTAAEEIAEQAWGRFQAIEAAGGFDAVWHSADGLPYLRAQHQRTVEALAMGTRTLVGTTRFLDDGTVEPAPLVTPNDLPTALEAGPTRHALERVSLAFERLCARGRKARHQRGLPPVLVVDLNPKRTAQARQLATDFFKMAGLEVKVIASLTAYEPDQRLHVACVLGEANSAEVASALQTLEADQPGLLRYVVQHPTALDAALQPYVDDCLHTDMNRLELIHDLHLSLGLV